VESARHLLVVASHCEAEGSLTGLHSTAHAFAEVLRDDLRGHCGVDDSLGVLLDADRKTIEMAVARAAAFAHDRVLVFVWIGHGRVHDQRFYLMPFDARAETIENSGVELIPLLKKIKEAEPKGIVVLIDACQSGTALVPGLEAWVQSQNTDNSKNPVALKPPRASIVILTATDKYSAFNLSFSKRLTELLRNGIGTADKDLSCASLRDYLREMTTGQIPCLLHYDDAPHSAPMWMSHNIAFDRKVHSGVKDLREHNLMLSHTIKSIARRLTTQSTSMAFIADVGAGKTILSAMLVQMPYDLRKTTKHQHFVDASLFATEGTVFITVVKGLADQLKLYKGFRDASLPFEERKDLPDQERMYTQTQTRPFGQQKKDLSDQERMLLSPLRVWLQKLDASNDTAKITLLLHGIDSMASGCREKVLTLLELLAALPGVRVLMTARSGAKTPNNVEKYPLDPLTNEEVKIYLSKANVHPALHDALVKRIGGNWLCAADFAEKFKDGKNRDPAEIVELTVKRGYEENLQRLRVCAEYPEDSDEPLTIVFMTLAAAGTGAVIPDALLRAACAVQGGPATDEQLDKELKKLDGLISRSILRETSPMWGLYHQELVNYVRCSEKYRVRMKTAHAAIVEALQDRVPNSRDAEPIEWRYAFDHELNHRLIVGKVTGELKRFYSIQSVDPGDNCSLWERLNRILNKVLKSDHPDMLATRYNLAYWAGESGDAHKARSLFDALLPDQERVLGVGHPDVLRTRGNLAWWTGQCGDAHKARDLFDTLLPDQKRVLGAGHPDVLRTRSNLAWWTGQCGDGHKARDLFAALLPDRERMLGADHPDVLRARGNLAYWAGESGDAHKARDLFAALLPDQARVLGPDHLDVLRTRGNLAYWTGQSGDTHKARDLFADLLPDQARVLGPHHPDVLLTRSNLAWWTGQCGEAREARDLFAELLPDQKRVLGVDHPDVLTTRNNLAWWTGQCGEAREARDLFAALLPDREQVLGAGHLEVLRTRGNLAREIGQCGDAREARDLFAELLPDQAQVLGPDHPDVLTTRNNLAWWTGQCGDAHKARDLFAALLPDQAQVLGPDHPDVLRARGNLAYWTGQSGDAHKARDLFATLLPDQAQVLGPDHPDVLTTRNNLALWTGQCGDAHKARDLFAALLPDQAQVLGPDHPDVLRARGNLAYWTGQSGDAHKARDLFATLLPDQERVLGPVHPDVLRTRNNLAWWTAKADEASI